MNKVLIVFVILWLNQNSMKYHPIKQSLFIQNRKNFKAKMLPNSLAVFNSNDIYPISADSTMPFEQHRDIFYLSGVDQEESILVLFPDAPYENLREILFLKDNQPILSQWESPISNTTYLGTATEVKMRFTILAMNTTVTVNGNVIDSVINVQNDLQYKLFGTYTTATTFNTFFAKNIGLINLDAPASFSQTIRRWKIY